MTKKKKRKSSALDESDYIQALDYSNALLASYYHTMLSCRVVQKNRTISKAFIKATEAMAELYQVIGRESHKNEQ